MSFPQGLIHPHALISSPGDRPTHQFEINALCPTFPAPERFMEKYPIPVWIYLDGTGQHHGHLHYEIVPQSMAMLCALFNVPALTVAKPAVCEYQGRLIE